MDKEEDIIQILKYGKCNNCGNHPGNTTMCPKFAPCNCCPECLEECMDLHYFTEMMKSR